MSGMFTQAKKASHNTRQDAVRFAEADIDCDGKLDYAEFLSMHPAIIREGHTEDEIRAWFEAADADGNGTISINEWFVYSLSRESTRSGRSSQDCVRAIFQQYDVDGTGSLDSSEFRCVCDDLGFGGLADEIFADLDDDASGFVQYGEIVDKIKAAAKGKGRAPTKMLIMAAAWNKHDAKVDLAARRSGEGRSILGSSEWSLLGSGWSEGLDAEDAEGLAAALRESLRKAGVSVVDLLKSFNNPKAGEASSGTDDFEIDPDEFATAMRKKLGFQGSNRLLFKTFELLDADGSGKIGFDELFGFILGRANHVSSSKDGEGGGREARTRDQILDDMHESWSRLRIDLEYEADAAEGRQLTEATALDPFGVAALEARPWSDAKLRLVMRALLRDNAMADVDLLQACDKDGSASVSKKEWLRCMKRVFVEETLLDIFAEGALEKWDEEIRPAIMHTFVASSGNDNSLSLAELAQWLAKGREQGRASKEQAKHTLTLGWKPPQSAREADGAKSSPANGGDDGLPTLPPLELISPIDQRPLWERGNRNLKALISPRDLVRQLQKESAPRYAQVSMTDLAAKQIKRFGKPCRQERSLEAAQAELLAKRRYWALKVAATRSRVEAVRRQGGFRARAAPDHEHQGGGRVRSSATASGRSGQQERGRLPLVRGAAAPPAKAEGVSASPKPKHRTETVIDKKIGVLKMFGAAM